VTALIFPTLTETQWLAKARQYVVVWNESWLAEMEAIEDAIELSNDTAEIQRFVDRADFYRKAQPHS
jgi:hypothetical protein